MPLIQSLKQLTLTPGEVETIKEYVDHLRHNMLERMKGRLMAKKGPVLEILQEFSKSSLTPRSINLKSMRRHVRLTTQVIRKLMVKILVRLGYHENNNILKCMDICTNFHYSGPSASSCWWWSKRWDSKMPERVRTTSWEV